MNLEIAHSVISNLTTQGVTQFIVCAGSYNSPLVFLLQKSAELKIQYHFDERGAAFFALGRIKRDGAPVAVVTTSGTAVAECLPAVVEAYFSELPLIIVSADRPGRFFETGAPQVINQAELLSSHTKAFFDLEKPTNFEIAVNGPTHINVRFEEPILGDEIKIKSKFTVGELNKPTVKSQHTDKLEAFLKSSNNLLVIVGELKKHEKETVIKFLEKLKAPVLAETLSALNSEPNLRSIIIKNGDVVLSKYNFDSVLRIGSVPTSSFWRDLSRKLEYQKINICSAISNSFTGTDRKHLICSVLDLVNISLEKNFQTKDAKNFLTLDTKLKAKVDSLIDELKSSEVGMLKKLKSFIPQKSLVYLGNSLPIREWGFVDDGEKQFSFKANRGANGIDGQIATFAGLLSPDYESWGILGDLTALYDVSSLILLSKSPYRFKLIVINNSGGKIFSQLPNFSTKFPDEEGKRFVNEHNFSLANIASGFGLRAETFHSVPDRFSDDLKVIELCPSSKEFEQFWAEYKLIFYK